MTPISRENFTPVTPNKFLGHVFRGSHVFSIYNDRRVYQKFSSQALQVNTEIPGPPSREIPIHHLLPLPPVVVVVLFQEQFTEWRDIHVYI